MRAGLGENVLLVLDELGLRQDLGRITPGRELGRRDRVSCRLGSEPGSYSAPPTLLVRVPSHRVLGVKEFQLNEIRAKPCKLARHGGRRRVVILSVEDQRRGCEFMCARRSSRDPGEGCWQAGRWHGPERAM